MSIQLSAASANRVLLIMCRLLASICQRRYPNELFLAQLDCTAVAAGSAVPRVVYDVLSQCSSTIELFVFSRRWNSCSSHRRNRIIVSSFSYRQKKSVPQQALQQAMSLFNKNGSKPNESVFPAAAGSPSTCSRRVDATAVLWQSKGSCCLSKIGGLK